MSHAFHSPLMDPMLEEFRRVAEDLTYHEPRVPVVSNLTGAPRLRRADRPGLLGPARTRDRPLRRRGGHPVRPRGERLVEIGPRPVLSGALADIAPAPLARKGLTEDHAALTGAGRLWARGVDVDWAAVFDGPARAASTCPRTLPARALLVADPGRRHVDGWRHEITWIPVDPACRNARRGLAGSLAGRLPRTGPSPGLAALASAARG